MSDKKKDKSRIVSDLISPFDFLE